VPQLLLQELGEPIMTSTLMLPGDELPLNDGEEIRERLGRDLDAILDGGSRRRSISKASRVLSGMRPTGAILHLGNYHGALRNVGMRPAVPVTSAISSWRTGTP
jgi:tRNA A37 threonylcarbamoyladenosine synthetase subunit TsaC/SUA5/YrdC